MDDDINESNKKRLMTKCKETEPQPPCRHGY